MGTEFMEKLYEQHWFALRTRSRYEKVVCNRLTQHGLEYLLPTLARVSQWTDRKKLIEVPLFPGYCFARFSAQERLSVLEAPGVLQIVSGGPDPEPIPYEEIDALKRLTQSGLAFEPYASLSEGMAVEIIRGPLAGVRGRLIRKERHHYVLIAVQLIQQGATVKIDINDISPIDSPVMIRESQMTSAFHVV
jgi:transcription antitermination factor NusG